MFTQIKVNYAGDHRKFWAYLRAERRNPDTLIDRRIFDLFEYDSILVRSERLQVVLYPLAKGFIDAKSGERALLVSEDLTDKEASFIGMCGVSMLTSKVLREIAKQINDLGDDLRASGRTDLVRTIEKIRQLIYLTTTEDNIRKTVLEALNTFGVDHQVGVVQEECAELIVAISHMKRDREGAREELIREAGDVDLMLFTLRRIFGDSVIDEARNKAAHKLANIVQNAKLTHKD